jgi:hypothetical protein
MKMYHVSFKTYKVGEKFSSKTITPYHVEKDKKGEGWVDLELNKYKPDNAPNREQCYYAFDFIGNCFAYIDKINGGGYKPNYYEVKLIDAINAPMRLTNTLLKAGIKSENVTIIANEYWSSTLDWKYYEFLSEEMEIVAILDEPNFLEKAKGKMNYNYDCELSIKTFGK